MAISDRQDDGHRASVDHDPQSQQSDGTYRYTASRLWRWRPRRLLHWMISLSDALADEGSPTLLNRLEAAGPITRLRRRDDERRAG